MSDAVESVHASVCPLDCPDRCSLEIAVREGRVSAIRGTHAHAMTAGFICRKVGRFHRRLYSLDRVLYPMRRSGPKGTGAYVRITWDEAVREIVDRFKSISAESGAEAIVPYFYGGSNGLLTQGLVDAHFFRRLGASRIARTLCAASTTAASEALYGKMPGVAFEDYVDARYILIWGANPTHSNIHLVPFLKEAKRRGAKVAVVDPRRILGAELVSRHLQPYPGSDVVLALGMICHMERQGLAATAFLEKHATGWRELFAAASEFPPERAAAVARVPADSIRRLAEEYAAGSPAVLRCGWGLERNRNGLASVAAVLALPAVAGKFGVRGGGYTLSNSGAFKTDDVMLAGVAEPATRVLNMSQLGRQLCGDLEPPIRSLFVYNCNPAATAPAHNAVIRGMRREDLFTVVHEQVWTDTAQLADIVLPATTFLEHRELSKSYGAYVLQLAEAAVEPVGEAKPNAEVFVLLGKAMGWRDGLFGETPEQWLERSVESVRGCLEPGAGAALRSRGLARFDFPGASPVQFRTVFPGTADGRIRLYPSELGTEPYRYLPETAPPAYPLALISPASGRTISSTLAEWNLLDVALEMSPTDAGGRALSDGCAVRVFNDLGEVHCRMRIEPRLRQGVVSLAKGIWRKATLNLAVGNALVGDDVTAVSGGACFNDARVQVEALGGAAGGK